MAHQDENARPRKGLEHKTMASAVASELRRRIVTGSFERGVPLRQDMLAREFGVSRVPIREALVQLESEGLVEIHAHRGAVVSTPSINEVRDVFELRELLEPRLLLESAPRLSTADLRELGDIASRYADNHRAGNFDSCAELNTSFHLGLYRHSSRTKTLGIVVGLLQDSERHTRLQLSYNENEAAAIEDDAVILQLCEQAQYEEASAVMLRHIRRAATTLLSSLESM